MRKDWEYKKLGEVCETSSGGTPSKTYTEYYENGTIPWLRSGEVSQGYIYDAEIYISELGLNKSSAKIFPKGTVLIAMYGATVGEVGILCNPMCTNQAICGVLPNDLYNSEFLRYVLLSHKDKYLSLAIGGAQPNISQQIIKNTLIPLIDKSTQLSIVAELDKINELIQLKKQQLKDYDQLAQSIFYEMFGDPVENEKGWEVKKLGEICDIRDGTHDSPKYVEHSDYLLITSKNIENNFISFENVNYITEEDFLRINKRSKVDDGDIIMPMIGTIGNPIIVKLVNNINFAIKNVALIKFYSTSSVINYYLQSLMKSSSFEKDITRFHKGGTQKFIALGTIRNFKIPLPPLPLQQQFAARIEAIERQKQQVSETIKDLETLLASRMQYWFD